MLHNVKPLNITVQLLFIASKVSNLSWQNDYFTRVS